jgi:hypothetical protein
MKMALVLVTAGVFHPGLALCIVWFVTMAFGVRLIVEARERQDALLVRLTDERVERAVRRR